jgi:hypothetical protein
MIKVEREMLGVCLLNIQVRSNGECGGDSGHGGRTSVTFRDNGGYAMELTNIKRDLVGDLEEFTLEVRGDEELRLLRDAFLYAANALSTQIRHPSYVEEDTLRLGESDA